MHFKKLLLSFPLWGKRWGGIWGANDFINMGWNMGRQYKEVFNRFLVFHQNDVYELQRPPYRVIIVMV